MPINTNQNDLLLRANRSKIQLQWIHPDVFAVILAKVASYACATQIIVILHRDSRAI